MPSDLLGLLRLCLLVLLYLFFLRVLRAVWVELNGAPALPTDVPAAPAARRPSRRAARAATRPLGDDAALHVVEPPERRGQSFPLPGELTLGRAPSCGVTLDDTFVSQHHARVFRRDGQVFVEDLGSTNGTYLNNRKVEGPAVVHPGDALQVGKTVMEVR